MSRKYGVGLQIIVAMLVVSSVLCGSWVHRHPPRVPRAAEDFGASARPVGPFQLEERSGRAVTGDDLAGRVAIASFIFTRCPLSCPRITGVMKGMQGELAGSNVLLVSISVDPEHDRPEVLKQYADRYGASPDRWWFLTGPRAVIYELIRDRFQLGVAENPGPVADDAEAILHSDRLALLDHGRIAGFFDSNDPEAREALLLRARRLALPGWVLYLPTLNAVLNGLSACLLFTGWVLIRRYRSRAVATDVESMTADAAPRTPWDHPLVRGHVACMIAAVCTSALFLACYLSYHWLAGSMPFLGGGGPRIAYLAILLSHTILATFSVPLILVTIRRGWIGRLDRHVSIGSLTLPTWLYVAVTGVVIYLMLYHLPVSPMGMTAGTSDRPAVSR